MPRKKLRRFAELATFKNTFVHPTELKGNWNAGYFKNDHPITLELACGKGEYTIGLAQLFPERNFIGVDIKGARMWKGAKAALELSLTNVAFLRTLIEKITDCFAENEVNEIWITFAEPFPKNSDANKRLTSPRFLNLYKQILKKGGVIHLKTDDQGLYDFTLNTIMKEGLIRHKKIVDVHHTAVDDETLAIKTTYERRHLQNGLAIKYLCFSF